jgi:hypothetical protein
VIVSADGKLAKGIVSERDIVRELGRRGAACLGDQGGKPDDRKDRVLHAQRKAPMRFWAG